MNGLPQNLARRIAVVTGGASGAGAAICREFAARGATVIIADWNEAGAQTLAGQIRDASGNTTTIRVGTLVRRDPITGDVVLTIVGRAGGTVTSQDGIRLIVPEGAVQRGTELAVQRLTEPFQLPADLATDATLVAAFNARFTVVDRIRITTNVARFVAPITLSLPASSGLWHSCQASLTMMTGARSQAPRHSTSSSVNVPLASVSPGLMPSFSDSPSVTRSAPFSAHESVRHTCSTNFPTGRV